jgi:peptidoglycan lytic transglycosylase
VGQHAPVQDAGGPSYLPGVGAPARRALAIILIVAAPLTITACGQDESTGLGERVIPFGQPVPKGGGRYQVGEPYEVAGIRYTPREDPAYDRTGVASWYGELFHGRYTANGEIYDMDRLSAAHPTLPLPVYAHVTNLRNGRSIVVRVNDRGPFKNDRIIDLSRRSAEVLGFKKHGTAPVRVRYLRRAPMNGDDSYELKYVAARGYGHYASKSGGTHVPSEKDQMIIASLAQAAARPPLPDRRPVVASPPSLAAGTPTESVAMAAITESLEATRSTPAPSRLAPPEETSLGGPAIQAGSFRSKDNAMRAVIALAEIGPVDVSAVDVGAETYYRVRVGPFADEIAAAAALPLVTGAGYHGAKILLQN